MRFNSIQELIRVNAWKPGHGASAFDSASNYAGEDFSDWVSVVGRNRDSDILTESNFECALTRLGGESKTVTVAHIGHWACGWFELILVKKTARKKLEIARDILYQLEDYPVLNEDHFSEMEWNSGTETLNDNQSEFRREFFSTIGFKNKDAKCPKRWESYLSEIIECIYRDACGGSGIENAWVSEREVKRYLSGDGKWELPRMAKNGNVFARAMINCGLVPSIEKE